MSSDIENRATSDQLADLISCPPRFHAATAQECVQLAQTYAHRPRNHVRPHRPARPSNAELSGILISAFELGFPCWGNTAAQNGPNMPLDP
jgi:hypothetical protein